MQIYKILSSDKLSEYTFIVSDIPVRNYRLIDSDNKDVFYAEDNEDGINFNKKLGKDFNYIDISDLKLFLDLIDYFDSGVFETFKVYQQVTVL